MKRLVPMTLTNTVIYRITAGLILLLSVIISTAQPVKFGNSYVNLSKKTVGGTVEPGDTLEIRTNYFFRGNYNGSNIYFVRYVDNIPSNTTYINDSLRLITNEGLVYKSFTDVSDADPATFVASPAAGEYNVRINIGDGTATPPNNSATNATGGGQLRPNVHKPKVGGNNLLLTTSFQVRVTGNIGDTITLGAGQLRYKKTNAIGDADTIVNAIQYQILISNNDPICSDAVGENFVGEAGGTFDSGFVHNRSYGPAYLIPNYTYRLLTPAAQIADGYYTLVNNLSPYRSTNNNSRKEPFCTTTPAVPALDSCLNRMFNGHWEIIGDHTGTTDAIGNVPKDTADPGSGGYMLVVNADYATSEAYRQDISGLCPNTSYEFSLWVRNVCTNCGIDSNNTKQYTPGVYPNLTFAIDDLDRYSSGQVDTVGWIKKGFLFKTGPSQTAITISIRNNASGGGGNDWAIDDIALVTCNPNLDMQPSPNAATCFGNTVDMFTTVSTFFDNYIHYVWEISTDDGATWSSTGESGTGTPVLNAGRYEYTDSFPTFLADSSSHMNQYRFKVASSLANLNSANCSFLNSTTITVLVNNCQWVLTTQLLSFTGKLHNNYAQLAWISADESPITIFDIERSNDGIHFYKAGTVNGKAAGAGDTYYFTDPAVVSGQAYYRIKISETGNYIYSKVILLNNQPSLSVRSLVNPFDTQLTWELEAPANGVVTIVLSDTYGRIIRQVREQVSTGLNTMRLNGLSAISNGVYTLSIQMDDVIINKRVVKM